MRKENQIYIIENIIVNMARDKYDKKIKCQCEESFNNTIIISLDEIKDCIERLDLIDFTYNDIEFLFYDTYEVKTICTYLFCCCKKEYDILILKFLRKRIKYHFFSRFYRKSNNIHISHSDSGELLIVFELK